MNEIDFSRRHFAFLQASELRNPQGILASPLTVCQGGFQPEMNRREAALILGLRETAAEERIKEAHRRIMVANHPDSGQCVQCGLRSEWN